MCASSGACVCPTSYSWNFDSNDTSGWSLSSVSADGEIGNAAVSGRTGFPLQIAGASFGTSITIQVTLCIGSPVQFPAGSFTFRADVRFESSSGVPFGDDGTGAGTTGLRVEIDQGASGSDVNAQAPIPLGTWKTISLTLPKAAATYVDLKFAPSNPWKGTIYVDNISIQ